MAVLTWQNVDGPRQGYGAPSIDSAIRAMNSGFTALQGVDKSFTDASNANFDNQKEQNTGAMINALAGISSIDELNKHKDSGAFSADNLKAQFGGAFDYEKFNKAYMDRRGQIQTDSENQLKLNEDTDYQANQGKLAQLTGLANTDTAAYNAALKNLDLGAATGKILGLTNPLMNDTRQDATTKRGQSLSYDSTMASVNVSRDRLNMEKAELQRKNALEDKDRAKKDTDGAFNAGSQYAYAHAGEGSDNDVTKGFTETDAYRQLNPLQKEAALKGLHQGTTEATQLTDDQQRDIDARMTPVNTVLGQNDALLKTAKANFDRQNPAFQVLRGAPELENMSQEQLLERFKNLDYNDKGGLADMFRRVAEKHNVPFGMVASAAQNLQESSYFRLWGWGREGVKLTESSLNEAVGKVNDWNSSNKAQQAAEQWRQIEQPQVAFTKQRDVLMAELKRKVAAHKDTASTLRSLDQLNKAAQMNYQQTIPLANTIALTANNQVPKGSSSMVNKGVEDAYYHSQR